MQDTILIVIITALVTSLTTLALAYLLYRAKLKHELEASIKRLGDTLEERVHDGVLRAGDELLPKFRDKVTEGFTKALAEWPTSEVTRMARSGANLVEEGLNTIFGKKRE